MAALAVANPLFDPRRVGKSLCKLLRYETPAGVWHTPEEIEGRLRHPQPLPFILAVLAEDQLRGVRSRFLCRARGPVDENGWQSWEYCAR